MRWEVVVGFVDIDEMRDGCRFCWYWLNFNWLSQFKFIFSIISAFKFMTIYASKKNILELESDVYKSNFSYCCVWLKYRPLLFNYVLTVDRGTVDKEQKGHITSKNGRPNRQTNVATGIYCQPNHEIFKPACWQYVKLDLNQMQILAW
jgi:hypothetical protein